ncbi:TraC family protein [Pelobacter propionicus]|uniref:Sex pilus assembly protein n=1 Tax=Pelobacter propionicus (strain DSM 2379 / NBRC 103807 / OttBd1) TaxID=338966 RepID=A0R7Q8_PELPD|nr:TraC family protein [Pelobacter propionicus]ABL01366.1 sex pilus assembly protein [Pelobacter propionicus DSM 2379]
MKRLTSLLFGKKGGATKREMRLLAEREKISDYLPWIAYDRDSHLYLLADDCLGYAWECSPLFFAGENTVSTLEGLFGGDIPPEAVYQFILFGDSYIEPILHEYKQRKKLDHDVVELITESLSDFYRSGTSGLKNMSGIPVKRFRLFISIKFPQKWAEGVDLNQTWSMINEILTGASLHPVCLEPELLLDWGRRLFNDKPSANNSLYDENIPIRKQMLLGTKLTRNENTLNVDGKIFRCITPKTWPHEIETLSINKLFGGIKGLMSDGEQFKTPFLYCMTVLMEPQKNKLHTKCNFILKQQGVGSFAPALERTKGEYLWAVDELERGKKFLRIIPALWVYSDDEWKVNESLTRAKVIWESNGFVMQEDRGILVPLFLASLPHGFYNVGNNAGYLERDFIVPAETIAATIPCQGDFSGFGSPSMLLVGRKGELFGFDLFAKGADNFNGFCVAGSGSGKSVFANSLLCNMRAEGNIIRIMDIGRSMKKLAKMFNARYMELSEDSMDNLNPFTHVSDETALQTIIPVVTQMAFSSGASMPSELDVNLIGQAVEWAYANEGNDAGITTVFQYLRDFKKLVGSESFEIREAADKLAFNLAHWSGDGVYAKYFNGKATFDIASDEMVVLELGSIKSLANLYRVVTQLVINEVALDAYHSSGKDKRFILMDEAHQYLGESSHIKGTIEGFYRMLRKHSAGCFVISQSILDLNRFGAVGEVIFNNSAYKFYLKSDDYEKAHNLKLLDYDNFTMALLKSVTTNKPNYSEIFMHTPFGKGLGRLVLDPFSYYAYTSDGEEVAEIESMVDGGLSYADAIRKMVAKYRS